MDIREFALAHRKPKTCMDTVKSRAHRQKEMRLKPVDREPIGHSDLATLKNCLATKAEPEPTTKLTFREWIKAQFDEVKAQIEVYWTTEFRKF